ncbi:hypothetical protein M8C21_001513 [Ambrosia artemisiifolia]|uniref:Mediator of RNA polymerase II transcription subunit 25 n=1 Tax=Ambrosia artemisiifolia TaxID=4212 RepID=A0AAD5G455_AMBAR|nr:hypothetical protein M8C21_001513 [Ambrosia artemisiifolia]
MTEKKQLVLAVEGTASLCPHWRTILSDYLEKVIRKFCGNEAMEAASSIVELALVQFNAHGSNSMYLVQRSGWVRNVDYFLECLSFSYAKFYHDQMCPPNGTKSQSTEVVQRHCILVAASNPCPVPTIYWPPNKSEMQSVSHLSDAETVAKSFPQSCVSLSVICPEQVPKLKEIYNAGKRNPSATPPTIDVKNPNYLVLISEDFVEACVALRPSVGTSSSNQSPSNMKVTSFSPVSEPPPTFVPPVNEYLPTLQLASGGNIPLATVKVEPSVSPIVFSRAGNTYSPSTFQELISSNDNLPYLIVGSGSASLTGASQVAQHAGTMMTAPRMSQQVQGMQYVGVNMGTNVHLSQQTSSALQSGQREYVIWEGKLDGVRQGQAVMITRLKAYRHSSSAESLVEDWPSTLLIDRLISVDSMNRKEFIEKCEFIVFQVLNQHGFLGQIQEKKLCAVIKLPSQTLLLCVTGKPFRLIGMLFPEDMVVFKPSQQLSQQQQRVVPGVSQGAGCLTHSMGVGQGHVSSLEPKPKQEVP